MAKKLPQLRKGKSGTLTSRKTLEAKQASEIFKGRRGSRRK